MSDSDPTKTPVKFENLFYNNSKLDLRSPHNYSCGTGDSFFMQNEGSLEPARYPFKSLVRQAKQFELNMRKTGEAVWAPFNQDTYIGTVTKHFPIAMQDLHYFNENFIKKHHLSNAFPILREYIELRGPDALKGLIVPVFWVYIAEIQPMQPGPLTSGHLGPGKSLLGEPAGPYAHEYCKLCIGLPDRSQAASLPTIGSKVRVSFPDADASEGYAYYLETVVQNDIIFNIIQEPESSSDTFEDGISSDAPMTMSEANEASTAAQKQTLKEKAGEWAKDEGRIWNQVASTSAALVTSAVETAPDEKPSKTTN
tara:strand:- start:311 stop:1243 length:933 start_codon:yes stop_codon:yes gene_type:complete